MKKPSILRLAFRGMLGRKRQSSLLLALLLAAFSFIVTAAVYSDSSAKALQMTRCELYGRWQYLRLSDSADEIAQVHSALPSSAESSCTVRCGIVLSADGNTVGGIGTIDDAFAPLGNVQPISGSFPAQSDQIAMTTTLLDALGCSYELGQTITLAAAENGYDPLTQAGTVLAQSYTLCGVLPAYDIYWDLNSTLTVSAIVCDPLPLDAPAFQLFYLLDVGSPLADSEDPSLLSNGYAYPPEDPAASSLDFLLAASLLVSFFAVMQYFIIVLHKRADTTTTFLILGASRRDLILLCLCEAVFSAGAALLVGFALGCGLAAGGLALQGQLHAFTLEIGRFAFLIPAFLLAVLLGALLPVLLLRHPVKSKREERAKRFRLVRMPLAAQLGAGSTVLLIAVSCLYISWRVMLPYTLDAPYACLTVKMNGTGGMPYSLADDLASLPDVEEVSAMTSLTDSYNVTSDRIRNSTMLSDIRVKSNGAYTSIPSLQANASRGTLNCFVCSLPDETLRTLAQKAGTDAEETERVLAGEAVLVVWADCFYDPVADEYASFSTPDAELVEPVFAPGDLLDIRYERYTGKEADGNEVYRSYEAALPVAGVVKSLSDQTLLSTGTLLSDGTILVSQSLYHEMFQSAGSYFMEQEGYTQINLRLAPSGSFSLRSSIASIVTHRNGILSSDHYDVLSQRYAEGTRSAFLVSVLGGFGVLLGLALLIILSLSAYEVQKPRLILLLTLGASPAELTKATVCRVAPVILGLTAAIDLLVWVAVDRLIPIQNILDLITIHTLGRQYDFGKPLGAQLLFSVLIAAVWLAATMLPVLSFLHKRSVQGELS